MSKMKQDIMVAACVTITTGIWATIAVLVLT